jgi:sialic acid synthase
MMRDIRNLDKSIGEEEMFIEPSVKAAREKLERSIASNREMEAGETIREEDLHMLSPGDGLKWSQRDLIINKKLINALPQNEIIYPNNVE